MATDHKIQANFKVKAGGNRADSVDEIEQAFKQIRQLNLGSPERIEAVKFVTALEIVTRRVNQDRQHEEDEKPKAETKKAK